MKKTNKITNRFLSMLVVLVMVMTLLPSAAFAANTSTSDNDIVISIGEKNYHPTEDYIRDQFYVFPYNAEANYTVVVDNKSVLKASIIEVPVELQVNGCKAVKLVGLKFGKTVVTLKETVNGKTTIISKDNVTVADSALTATGNYAHNYGLGKHPSDLRIVNHKVDAEYFATVNKPGVTVKFDGSKIFFDSTAIGDYKVTFTEKYNGVTKVLKTIDVHVFPMSITPKITMENNWYVRDPEILNYQDNRYVYRYESEGIDVNLYDHVSLLASFEDAVTLYERNSPGVKYHVEKCFIYQHRGFLISRMVGTQVISVYKTDKNDPELHEYVGSCTITIVPEGTLNK